MFDKFLARLQKTNISKPYMFEVVIPDNSLEMSKLLTFYAKSTTLPQQNVNVLQIPFQGRILKYPGEKTYQDWMVTFINDESHNIRHFFELWGHTISDNARADRKSILQNGSKILKDIEVKQLDTGDEEVITYKLHGCFPSIIGTSELNWESINTTQDFMITFSYQYFTTNRINEEYSTGDIINE